MPVDECKKNKLIATARCHPKDKADNHGVLSRRSSKSEDGYFNGTTGLPVGIHKGICKMPPEKNEKYAFEIANNGFERVRSELNWEEPSNES